MDVASKKNKDKINIKTVKTTILFGYLILALMLSIIYADEIGD